MGGPGHYHEDVRRARQSVGTVRESASAFQYSEQASKGLEKGVHPELNILGKVRECCDSADHPNSTPIVIAADVTDSRGDDAKIIHSQLPSMMGSLMITDLVPDPEVCVIALGDANCDRAPLQVGQFEANRLIDKWLELLWLEGGGGGTGEESYELGAYFGAYKTRLDCLGRGKKGFFFFLGDEAPYPTVSPSLVKAFIGDTLKNEIPTEEVFRALQEKFYPFLIFPRSSMEARKASIDNEIRKRLEAAGGRFKEVSIRASLIWNNRNDLDLHCLTPGGFHIYYCSKKSHCGGELDVDRNVHGEDPKPVENIRWAKGQAPRGRYQVWVENYAYHEQSHAAIPFKVELDIEGQIKTFEGTIPANTTSSASQQVAFEFFYDPADHVASRKEAHAAYQTEVVVAKWSRYIPEANILLVQDAASSIEVMLGAIALQTGKMTLAQFEASMKDRKVSKERRTDTLEALRVFASQGVFQQVNPNVFG